MKLYMSVPRKPGEKQISILDILDGKVTEDNIPHSIDKNYTRTYEIDGSVEYFRSNRMYEAIAKLSDIVKRAKEYGLIKEDMSDQYWHFKIPKKTHGWRDINAPLTMLRAYQDEFVEYIKKYWTVDDHGTHYALHHTNAYAYIEKRCTKDAIIKHKYNESKWFGKTDFSDFFGNCKLEWAEHMLSMIYPVSTIMASKWGRQLVHEALMMCYLNGGLPQGTTVSPLLTNLLMIPIDFELTRQFKARNIVYTRYADDIQISSKISFNLDDQVKLINAVLAEFQAPFRIKEEKLRYGSNAGRNWNLGLMYNKDNEITVGAANINLIKVMTHNFILDTLNDKRWDRQKILQYQGLLQYFRFIQPERINGIIEKYSKKYNVDLLHLIKMELKR